MFRLAELRTLGSWCNLACMKKMFVFLAVLLMSGDRSPRLKFREAMGDGNVPIEALGTNEYFAIGMASNAKEASSLTLEFRSNGVILVELHGGQTGQLVRAEKLQLSRSEASALRMRIAAFRPPARTDLFLPRGCTYTYDVANTVTLAFINDQADANDDRVKFVYFQTTCRSRWAELGLTEIRSIIASLPQTALIRSRVL